MMNAEQPPSVRKTVFFLAARADAALADNMKKSLRSLEWQGVRVRGKQIVPGMQDLRLIQYEIDHAAIILLLISPDLLDSDIYNAVTQYLLTRPAIEQKRVVPILLRPVLLEGTPLAELSSLPLDGKFVTKSRNRDQAWLEIAEGLKKLLQVLSPVPPNLIPVTPPTDRLIDIEDRVNVERALKRVQMAWLTDGLKEQVPLIDPDLHEVPDALEDPWLPLMQEREQTEHVLKPGTQLIDIYDEAQGALLVLGEAGAGKTTLLLTLMRKLIERTRANGIEFLPVYLHLVTWSKKQLPLATWIIEELQNKYNISGAIAEKIVNKQLVVLLLDGLDTLAADTMQACVNAINVYKGEHDDVPIMVCSRSSEYLALRTRLKLNKAISIQPLSEPQINCYLAGAGKLTELRGILDRDVALHTLATTPLILSILTKVDQKLLKSSLETANIGTLRHAIFAAYVESVLARGIASVPTSPGSEREDKRWLAALARQMEKDRQIIFYPAQVQPDWLTKKWALLVYYAWNGLAGALLSGVVIGLVGNIAGGQFPDMLSGLIGALVGGAGFVFAARKIRPLETKLTFKGQVRSLLSIFALWMLVLLTGKTGGLTENTTMLIAIFSFPLLLIGQLLREPAQYVLDDIAIVPIEQGLRQSARNGIRVGLLVGASFALLIALFQLSGVLQANVASYWLLIPPLGLMCGLIAGGLAALQLKGLYWLLWRSGVTPKEYVVFLDEASSRSLLSKAGNGYLFRYPLLQSYFATLPPA
ncbi:MAG: hypothetical protein NVSMB44_32610 [Ktedonobacteraceae bacterium]